MPVRAARGLLDTQHAKLWDGPWLPRVLARIK